MSWPVYLYEDKADYDWFVYHQIKQTTNIYLFATGYRIRSGRGYYPPQLKIYLVKNLPYLTGMWWKWREN